MNNVVLITPLVARSFSTRIRDVTRELEPVASCSSYVLGWVKSEMTTTSKTA